jgi:putative N6-adenine-specific DNA methylase
MITVHRFHNQLKGNETMVSLALTENSLGRRIKKYLPKEDISLFIPCPPNLHKIAAAELTDKKVAEKIVATEEGLELTGDWKTIYQCNLNSSVGTRVLVRIADFYVGSYPEFFQKIKRIHWEIYIGFQKNFDVKVTSKESRLHHTDNIQKTFAEAVQLKMKDFEREVIVKEGAVPCFYLRFFQDRCTVSLDTTGDNLYKRGYKKYQGEAPLRENLAAAMIKYFSKEPNVLVDPLCGSGTFGFEFLLDRLKIPPGSFRKFSFEQLPYFQEVTWGKIKNYNRVPNEKIKVYLNDQDANCVAGILETAKFLDLESHVVTNESSMNVFLKKMKVPSPYILLTNMPYGKRIKLEKNDVLKDLLTFCRTRKEDGPYGFVALKAQILKYKVGLNKQVNIKNGGLETIFCYKE